MADQTTKFHVNREPPLASEIAELSAPQDKDRLKWRRVFMAGLCASGFLFVYATITAPFGSLWQIVSQLAAVGLAARCLYLLMRNQWPGDFVWAPLKQDTHAKELGDLRRWAATDRKLQAYLARVATQGRVPVFAEWEMAAKWVSSPTRRAMSR